MFPNTNFPVVLEFGRFTLDVLTCDSITVSVAWELTIVSMRYSQGEGVDTSLSRITYCTHVLVWCNFLLYLCSFPVVCVWVPSVARSCATKDAKNKDNVWKPTVPAGINCPPPSETISPITWFGAISTRLAGRSAGILLDLQARDPVRQCIFI